MILSYIFSLLFDIDKYNKILQFYVIQLHTSSDGRALDENGGSGSNSTLLIFIGKPDYKGLSTSQWNATVPAS